MGGQVQSPRTWVRSPEVDRTALTQQKSASGACTIGRWDASLALLLP